MEQTLFFKPGYFFFFLSKYNERNQLYTKLLNQYIDIYQEKENAKKKYKKVYFVITMVAFTVIIAGCVISILSLPKSNTGGFADIKIVCN